MTHDSRVGPLALSVALLIAVIAYRRSWPRLALSTEWLGKRLQLPAQTVNGVIDALVALGYLVIEIDGTDRAGRKLLTAAIPTRPPAEETSEPPSEVPRKDHP